MVDRRLDREERKGWDWNGREWTGRDGSGVDWKGKVFIIPLGGTIPPK